MRNKNTVWKMIEDMATKKGITEIVINGPQKIFVERDGHFIQLKSLISAEDIFSFTKDVFENEGINKNNFDPLFNGKLPGGDRINIVMPPIVDQYPAITIRRHSENIKSFEKNPDIFGLGKFWIDFFKACVSAKKNIIVSGGTGVGKTTLLNLFLNEIASAERIVTIEDIKELSVSSANWVAMEVPRLSHEKNLNHSITMTELVKNGLRMRPDRIIIGEVRGGEMFDLLQSMNTGHQGSMTSIHANDTKQCIFRMENLVLLSGYDLPILSIKRQLASALDFIVQLGKNSKGERIVTQISEITGMEGHNLLFSQLGELNENEILTNNGIVPRSIEDLHRNGGLALDYFFQPNLKAAS